MDVHLKALADISMALSAAEAFLDEAANLNARDQLDTAAEGLAALRAQWPQLSTAERTLVGRTAAPLRDRLDAGRARLPKLSALVEVAPGPGEGEDDDGGPVAGEDAPAPGAPVPDPLPPAA
jgi:hypothetical protein